MKKESSATISLNHQRRPLYNRRYQRTIRAKPRNINAKNEKTLLKKLFFSELSLSVIVQFYSSLEKTPEKVQKTFRYLCTPKPLQVWRNYYITLQKYSFRIARQAVF